MSPDPVLVFFTWIDHFNLPPTVQQKEVLSGRNLFPLPSNTDQMATFPSPSSLSEFEGSQMVRISNNRKAAGLFRKSLSTLDYTEWFEATLVLGFIFILNLILSDLCQQPGEERNPLLLLGYCRTHILKTPVISTSYPGMFEVEY